MDYVLCTGCMKYCVKSVLKIQKVPYGPHFGYMKTRFGNSYITGTRINIPYDLPFLTFEAEYENMETGTKDHKLHDTKTAAIHILQQQKQKTGYAFLGTPPVEILIDEKVPEEIKNKSKQVGEQLALNALTTEYSY